MNDIKIAVLDFDDTLAIHKSKYKYTECNNISKTILGDDSLYDEAIVPVRMQEFVKSLKE